MVTFFTTTKAFTGKNSINQMNAIRSWVLGNRYNCEVIIFQKSAGVEMVADLPNIRIIENTEVNDNGVPYINAMFLKASLLASNNIVCFLNADIIVNEAFIEMVIDIHEKVKLNYLIVGQRLDTSFDFLIDYNNVTWYSNLENELADSSSVHLPAGSDFFVFPKNQYQNDLPPLLIGRPGWDLYMIYHARKNHYKLIDLSPGNLVIHQDHDYGHKSTDHGIKATEDNHNYKFLPDGLKYTFQLSFCNFSYVDGKIKKTYCNYDLNRYYYQECCVNPSIVNRILLRVQILALRLIIISGRYFGSNYKYV